MQWCKSCKSSFDGKENDLCPVCGRKSDYPPKEVKPVVKVEGKKEARGR